MVLCIEYVDRRETVHRRLNQDGGARSPGPQLDHALASQVTAGVFGAHHVAHAVGGVADQPAVVVDHRVHRTADLGGGRELVAQIRHLIFVRHGNVEALHPQLPQAVHRCLQPVWGHVEGQVLIIQAQQRAGFVVHLGGDAVGHRAAQQAQKAGVSGCMLTHNASSSQCWGARA